jgi:hypothetical protein
MVASLPVTLRSGLYDARANPARISALTPDEYVDQMLTKYQVATGTNSTSYVTAMAFKSTAEQWAGNCLRSVAVSGSFAKLTAVSSKLAGRQRH